MPKPSARDSSRGDAIDRQLQELQLQLDALAATVDLSAVKRMAEVQAKRPPGPRGNSSKPKSAAASVAPGAVEPAHKPTAPVAAAAPVNAPARGPGLAPATKPLPTGTDLADPTNFGVLPDRARLEGEGLDRDALRHQLTGDIKWAQQILHTSGVPAAVWREWRSFEQSAIARLRSLE